MPSDLAASFTRETRKSLFGVWPPGQVIELGAFGVLDGDLFRPLGQVTRSFKARLSEWNAGPKLQMEFKSAGAREIRGSANASVGTENNPAQGKITTKLTFKHGGSTYFRAKDTVYSAVENLADVNEAIMAAFAAGTWEGHYALVHGLFRAAGTTIIISSEDHAEIELEGTASVGGLLDLADVGADIRYREERDIAFKVLAKPGLTPLICLSQIRPRNRLLALLGTSMQTIRPLLAASGPGGITSDSMVTKLSPEVSLDEVKELGMPVRDMFQLAEIE